jgi:glyoxylase-like metal-dependent hydrolase (beta-lactamase superfamily II)
LVGGGNAGFNLSAPLDCHVYLLDGGDDLVLVDSGSGIEGTVDAILANIERDGVEPARFSRLLLTHYHADHAGAAAEFAARLGLAVQGSAITAAALATGDVAPRARGTPHRRSTPATWSMLTARLDDSAGGGP